MGHRRAGSGRTGTGSRRRLSARIHEQPWAVSAEVDGNPHRVTFAQRVGVREARMGGLRVTLRVTA